MDEQELRLFGRLVRSGVLQKDQVEELLAAVQTEGGSLAELAVERGYLGRDRLERLRLLDGEDVPQIPRYRYRKLLGKGGTAVVVKARDEKSGEDIAIKVLLPELGDLEEARRGFLREAKLLISLDHENVVKGYKVGSFEGRLMFLMEYVPGRSLQDLLRDQVTFNEDQGLYIILQAARALQYLSSQGVVHRDIKPDNILLTRRNQVKLIDLGFAASSGTGGDRETTAGTVAYMAPEQARGQGDLDVRSDIYSLGATLYQLVVGELPFAGESNQDVMAAQILKSLSSEVLKSRKISPHMHYFIEKMMAKERDVRYQDPAELIADIEEQIRGKKSLVYDPDGADRELLDRPYDAGDDEEDDDDGMDAGGPGSAPSPTRYPTVRRRRRR